MPDRVVEQDHHELVEAIRVAVNLDAARRFELEYLTGSQRPGGAHRLRGDFVQPHPLAANWGGLVWLVPYVRIRAGEEEEIIEESPHAVAFAVDVVERGREIGRVEVATVETRLAQQDVDIASNRGQRCAQLV